MIAKGKFCLTRSARLRLSWLRQPVGPKLPLEEDMGYPVEHDPLCHQEETHAKETTNVDHPASTPCAPRGGDSLGPRLSSDTYMDQPCQQAGRSTGGSR